MIKDKLKNIADNKKKLSKLGKILENCNIITFDPKDIRKRIVTAYKIRKQAHELLLRADITIDNIINELSGYKDYENK